MRPYLVGDDLRIAASWMPDVQETRYRLGMDRAQILYLQSTIKKQGFQFCEIGGYLTSAFAPDPEQFFAVWRKVGDSAREQSISVGVSIQEVRSQFAQLHATYWKPRTRNSAVASCFAKCSISGR